jgi:hypothetical protein
LHVRLDGKASAKWKAERNPDLMLIDCAVRGPPAQTLTGELIDVLSAPCCATSRQWPVSSPPRVLTRAGPNGRCLSAGGYTLGAPGGVLSR